MKPVKGVTIVSLSYGFRLIRFQRLWVRLTCTTRTQGIIGPRVQLSLGVELLLKGYGSPTHQRAEMCEFQCH